MELSAKRPIKALCEEMPISRSGYYKRRARLLNPCPRAKKRVSDIIPFERYRKKYPSHGYRWLNAKMRLGLGAAMSDQHAHRCRKFAGIKSQSKHYKHKKPGEPKRIFPNAVTASINVDGPLQCVVSDMTAFWANKAYWELALYMGLWNDEIWGAGSQKERATGTLTSRGSGW